MEELDITLPRPSEVRKKIEGNVEVKTITNFERIKHIIREISTGMLNYTFPIGEDNCIYVSLVDLNTDPLLDTDCMNLLKGYLSSHGYKISKIHYTYGKLDSVEGIRGLDIELPEE